VIGVRYRRAIGVRYPRAIGVRYLRAIGTLLWRTGRITAAWR
jgi:hypothetical protein